MTRPLRIEYKGALYHVMSHGTGLLWIYKDIHNFKNYIDLLERVKLKYGFVFHTFILMKNHYHILLETPQGNLSRGMLYFNRELARAYNKYHKRSGAVLKSRYKAILIEKVSYYKNVFRYINQNATRKQLEKRVQDYKGSPWYYLNSKKDKALSEKIMAIISWDSLEKFLGYTDIKKVLNWLNEKEEPPFKEDQRYKYILGRPKWIDMIKENYVNGEPIDVQVTQWSKIDKRTPDIWKLFRKLKEYEKEKEYKNIVLYLLWKYTDMTQKELAGKLGLPNSNAAGQRLFLFKKRVKKNKDLAVILDEIERNESHA